MTIQKRLLFVTSILISSFIQRFSPQHLMRQSFWWTIAAIYIFQLFTYLSWNAIIYPKLFSPLRHLPSPPGANFFMGHAYSIFTKPTGSIQRDWIDKIPNDGLIVYRSLFNEPRILLTTPKAFAEVLVHRNYDFIKPLRLRTSVSRILGVGIFLAEGDEHKRQRKLLMPAFSFRHVKDLYSVFWEKSRELTDAISASIQEQNAVSEKSYAIIEISSWASRATLDIIGLAGFGQDFEAIQDPNNKLNQTYRSIFTTNKLARTLGILGNFIPVWFLRALPIKRNEELQKAVKLIRKTAYDLVQAKRQKLEKGGRTDTDILSVAMESGGFSDDDLVNQLMTFLAAGHETTASALTWAVYLLCCHPEVQTRLREDVRAALPSVSDPDSKISSVEIDHIAYLNAFINETMRLYPPVPLTLREAAHDTTINGHFVPSGTTVLIVPWAINTSRSMWGDDSAEFIPDRWMREGKANTGGADSNYSFMTFLHGPRSCIGKDFAKAEFACLVAAVVGRFELELEDPNMKLDVGGGITMKPRGGLHVKIRPVKGW